MFTFMLSQAQVQDLTEASVIKADDAGFWLFAKVEREW